MVFDRYKPHIRRFTQIALLTIAAVLILKIGLALLTVLQIKRASAALQATVQQASTDLTPDYDAYWEELKQTNQALSRELFQMRVALWPLDKMADTVAPYWWGKDWAGAVYLLEIGEELTAATKQVSPIIDSAIMSLKAESLTQEELIKRLKISYTRLAESSSMPLTARHEQITENQLKLERLNMKSDWLTQSADQMTDLLPLAQSSLLAIQAVPTTVGLNQEHRILVLLQNKDELRPTGGFITSSIYLVVESGKIKSIETLGSNDSAIDHFAERYYNPPPAQFTQYMELTLWLFRDANWSPDFPTSAAKAASLYSYGRDVEIDTVIALNQTTIEELLKVTGPLQISEDESLSADNAQLFFQDLWTEYRRDSVGNRKLFISDLVPSLVTAFGEITTDSNNKIVPLTKTLLELAQSGDLLIYSTDSDLQRWAEASGLDGSIPTATQDYLYPVITNMGYDKSDFVMERSLDYHVSLHKISEPFGVLTLTANNKGLATPGICPPQTNQRGVTYLQRATSCNVNYLRLYLPNRSELLRATQFAIPESHTIIKKGKEGNTSNIRPLTDEREHNVFGGIWITPPQINNSGRFVYTLHPAEIFRLTDLDTLTYQLLVQKQPGAGAQPAQITIDLPANLQLKSVSPQPAGSSAQSLVFDLTLDRDLEIKLEFDVAQNQLEQIGVLLSDGPMVVSKDSEPRFVPTQFPLELESQ
ncbi:MAG: DUF4012 domain-containing protein [Anaerolineae bacterium]